MSDERTEAAVELMLRFADRSGLTSDREPRRYLWTDAFAVCNFLGLRRRTGDRRFTELALLLVERVHQVLGRHRPDQERSGWLSGLDDEQGALHPTAGGLRIGKPLPERAAGEAFDERLEWDRDGQYFHYLTKWMHALDQVTRATGDPRYNAWACELAIAAQRAFTALGSAGPGGVKRMCWKASVDLTRALVPSMGQHDPLDGFVTAVQLDATREPGSSGLAPVIESFAAMLEPADLATSDPLGIGGLLGDAYRVRQLIELGALPPDVVLVDVLLDAGASGIDTYLAQGDLRMAASRRLAFRELGLAIGLAAVERLAAASRSGGVRVRQLLDALARVAPVRADIESLWRRRESRQTATWLDHADINDVMLAASLVPESFLVLGPGVRTTGS